MCGIIAYIGPRPVVSVLLDGLSKLEYRGYDSAGVAVVGEQLAVVKAAGRISELEAHPTLHTLSGEVGIGHTRWATHGEPCDKNSHPHVDCSGQIAVVHNGIIENADGLRAVLEKDGHVFTSDTDSEVISHLIEKFYTGDLVSAVRKALHVIEGTFGIAVVHKEHSEIVAARRGSPLVIGLSEGECFVASDVMALLPYTKRVVYLNDDEIATVKKDGFSLQTIAGEPVSEQVHEIKWSAEQIQKGNYKHYMLKEIHEQPEAIANTLRGRLVGGKIKLSVQLPKDMKRIILIGCGTSWHGALIGKHLIEQIAGVPCEVDYASEFRYRNPLVNEHDLVIAMSQSGETADTLAALREAKSKGATTLGIVNVVGSTVARDVDSGIYLHAGPEIGVASTKAFTCQVTALTLFALYLRQEQGKTLDKELLSELTLIPDRVRELLKQNEAIEKLAANYSNVSHFLYLGRGVQFPAALEGALKLKEISYIHAEGYPAAEMKHGPIALIDEHMPVCFIAPKDRTYEKILSNMQEIKARKGKILAIVNENDERVGKLADHVLVVPSVPELLSPLVTSIPLQLFAYHIADKKGLNVDKPRNLAKAVTVE